MKVDLTLLERINQSISRGSTGRPEYFAENMGISKRQLYLYIEFLKSKFRAPIAYSRAAKTFHFKGDWEFYMGDVASIKAGILKDIKDAVEKL